MPNSGSTPTARILALTADVLGDVGAYSIYPWTAALEPVQVVSFLPGPYRIADLSRQRARGRDLEAADRTLSRRRPADLDLRHGAADRHGGARARTRSRPRSGGAISSSRTNFPTRSRPASCGTAPASSRASKPRSTRSTTTSLRAAQAEARAPRGGSSASASRPTRSSPASARASRRRPACRSTPARSRRPCGSTSTGAVTGWFGVASHGQGLETTLAQVDRRRTRLPLRGYPDRAGRQRGGGARRPAPTRAAARCSAAALRRWRRAT